jgi:hypothetical protein
LIIPSFGRGGKEFFILPLLADVNDIDMTQKRGEARTPDVVFRTFNDFADILPSVLFFVFAGKYPEKGF